MNKVERLAKQKLEDEGYQVEYPIHTQWHRVDFFNGLWDFIAVSSEKIRFVQVSVTYMTSGSHAKKDYPGFICPPNCTKEYWKYDRKAKEFKITILNKERGEK